MMLAPLSAPTVWNILPHYLRNAALSIDILKVILKLSCVHCSN